MSVKPASINPVLGMKLSGTDVSPIDPSELSDLQLWLRSDVNVFKDDIMSEPVTDNDDPVGGWADGSGNDLHFIESTNKPKWTTNFQNGLPVVNFDGSNDILTSTGYGTFTDFSLLTVIGRDAGSGDSALLNENGGDLSRIIDWNRTVDRIKVKVGASEVKTGAATYPETKMLLVEVHRTGSDIISIKNKEIIAFDTTFSIDLLFHSIGRAEMPTAFWNGQIGEIIFYNRRLTDDEIAGIQSYLNDRWALY